MSGLETAALRAAAAALPLIGRRLYSSHERKRITEAAASHPSSDRADDFLGGLDPGRASKLQAFLQSPQFAQLMLQALTYAVGGAKEESRVSLREEVRLSIKHQAIFSTEDLVEATDAVEALMYGAVQAVRAVPGNQLDSAHAVAISAHVATASVRNSEILEKLAGLSNINRLSTRLRTQVKGHHSKIRLPAAIQARQIALDKLYIPPALQDAESDTSVELSVLALQKLRVVVLGDPGAGKSTLASKLAYDLAADRIAGLEGQVPLVMAVREHTTDLRSRHETLLHYLEAAARQPYGIRLSEEQVEYLLLNGLATVIIDGLDELGDAAYRTTLVNIVESFASLYPLTRIFITSRSVGYNEVPLDDSLFQVATVSSFDRYRVQRYARLWFSLDPSIDHAHRGARIDSFLVDSRDVEDLRSNPLMLTLLCALYSTDNFIPPNRPEIYQRCAEVLFESWDRSRGIEVPFRFRSYLRPAVQELAWRLFTDSQGRQALPKSELRDFLATKAWADRFDSEAEAVDAAEDFLNYCAGRAWVLTDTGADAWQPHYGFTHKTFLEFFAASQLVRLEPEPAAVWNKLRARVGMSSWTMTSQLAVQILDRERASGANHILDLLISEYDEPRVDQARNIAFLDFAAGTVGYVSPGNTALRRVVDRVVRLACSLPMSSRISTDHKDGLLADQADLPLGTLLTTTARENRLRVARAVASTAGDLALDDIGGGSSAGFIFNELRLGSSPVLSVLDLPTVMAEQPVPPSAQLWSRLLAEPSAKDLLDTGLSILYSAPSFLSWRPLSWVEDTLGTILQSGNASQVERAQQRLERIYPALEQMPLEKFTSISLGTGRWDEVARKLSKSRISGLRVDSRAATLLLLIPILERVPDRTVEDDGMSSFARAHVEESRRTAAIGLLNRWELPGNSHYLLRDWILAASR